jgi:hypothetical protein
VMGLRMYSFIDVMIDCLNYVPSVALKSAAFNPSWHLTAVGAGRFAIAVHTASGAARLLSLGSVRHEPAISISICYQQIINKTV